MRWLSRIFLILIISSICYSQQGETQAPSFYLRGLDGEDFFASQVYGPISPNPKPLVLSFFATWCVPCRAEVPELELLSKRYTEVQFRLISVKDNEGTILQWLSDVGVELPVLIDKYGVVSKKFGVIGENSEGAEIASLPTLVIIDSSGSIVYKHTGYARGDEIEIERVIRSLNH